MQAAEMRLIDVLSGANYERDGAELLSPGIYVELGPWNYHLFQCAPEQAM